jgi:hypothetical protein
MAVLVLWTFVGFWNSYFDALIYIRDLSMYPLQLILREILVQSQVSASEMNYADANALRYFADLSETLKYALIIVSTVPILLIYPFFQRFFCERRHDWRGKGLAGTGVSGIYNSLKAKNQNAKIFGGSFMKKAMNNSTYPADPNTTPF